MVETSLSTDLPEGPPPPVLLRTGGLRLQYELSREGRYDERVT